MTSMNEAISQVLNAPPRTYTRDEAQEMFRRYGVLDSENKVTEEFSQIFVERKEQKDARN